MKSLYDHLNLDPVYKLVQADLNKPLTFKSGFTEIGYQRILTKIKDKIANYVIYFLLAMQVVLLLPDLKVLSIKVGIRSIGAVVIFSMSAMEFIEGQKKNKTRTRQKVIRKTSKSGIDFEMSSHNMKVILLICVQELSVFEHASQVYYWISSFMLAAVIHLSMIESVDKDKKPIQIRLAVQFVCLLIDGLYYPWMLTLLLALRMIIVYVSLLNLQVAANKWMRLFYRDTDSIKKWSEQLTSTLDDLPYPLFIVSMKDLQSLNEGISERPFVKIAYFNYFADNLMRLIDPEDSSDYVNFLDLIAKEDSMTLVDESYRLAQGEVSKAIFTTEISRDLFKHSDMPSSLKHDLTMWKCKWRDDDAIAIMFNSDPYVSSKVNRFAAKYLKGLDYMLEHCENEIEGMTRQLNKYYNKQIDQRKIIEHASTATINLWSSKLVAENFVLFEDLKEEFTNKNFRIKTLLVNLVDWAAKDFCAKDISVNLTFALNYPFIIKSKIALMKALFFNLLKYLEMSMKSGSLSIHCDSESMPENERDEFETSLMLQFKFTLTSPEGFSFPETEFLTKDSSNVQRDYLIRDDLKDLLLMWLDKIKSRLDLQVQFADVNNFNGKLNR